jgi:hypothetical protein
MNVFRYPHHCEFLVGVDAMDFFLLHLDLSAPLRIAS